MKISLVLVLLSFATHAQWPTAIADGDAEAPASAPAGAAVFTDFEKARAAAVTDSDGCFLFVRCDATSKIVEMVIANVAPTEMKPKDDHVVLEYEMKQGGRLSLSNNTGLMMLDFGKAGRLRQRNGRLPKEPANAVEAYKQARKKDASLTLRQWLKDSGWLAAAGGDFGAGGAPAEGAKEPDKNAAAPRDPQQALSGALVRADIEALGAALKAGADPNKTPEGQMTPLVVAVRRGHLKMVEALLEAKADPNGTFQNWTPLHWAIAADEPAMIDVLVKGGAEVAAMDPQGNLPLLMAVRRGSLKSVQALLDAKADPNATYQGWTPLHWAVMRDQPELIAPLVKAGAKVEVMDLKGDLPLLMAVRRGNPKVVEPLLEATANPNATYQGWTPLHWAVSSDKAEMIALLLNAGASIDAKDLTGNTPLDLAKKLRRERLIEMMTKPPAKPGA